MIGLNLKINNNLFLLFMLAFIPNSNAQNNLEFYLNKAMLNSPLLKDYRNQAELARIDRLRINAGLGFQVSVVNNNLYAPAMRHCFAEMPNSGTFNTSASLA